MNAKKEKPAPMDADKKAVLAVVALVCMTILYAFLFVSLWTYKELVGVSLLGLISVSVLPWRMVDARGKLNEQELRHLRYRYQEETPLDAQGEAHYWPQGAQTNPHRRSPYSYQPSQYEGYQEQQRQEHEPLMKERQQRRARPVTAGQAAPPQPLTKAVTHIRLSETNAGKLAALDALAEVYLTLAQAYVTLFCTEERPNKFRETCFATPLSERWQRVAIQQAAGIAHSWRTNREQAYQDYLEASARYQDKQQTGTLDPRAKEPQWREWQVPALRQPCIQANVNVVALEASQDSTFDYWLRISTLEKGKPLRVPVKLSDYHRKALAGHTINSSVQLNRGQNGTWWVTLSYDEVIVVQTAPDAPVIGMDVGIANFVTTSDGRHYGTFHGKLRERHKRDREKRRRKAKLRACLKKKGVQKLPSTSSARGQRLQRHVKQEINRAVNQCFDEHPDAQLAYEQLSVSTMRFKARAMNAYLRASNLAHIPKQIAWNAAKRGRQATAVKSAYSSQECSVCHYTDRKNRPDQQTFCCQVCGQQMHADVNAACNLHARVGDAELRACRGRHALKVVLMQRHQVWREHTGWS